MRIRLTQIDGKLANLTPMRMAHYDFQCSRGTRSHLPTDFELFTRAFEIADFSVFNWYPTGSCGMNLYLRKVVHPHDNYRVILKLDGDEFEIAWERLPPTRPTWSSS